MARTILFLLDNLHYWIIMNHVPPKIDLNKSDKTRPVWDAALIYCRTEFSWLWYVTILRQEVMIEEGWLISFSFSFFGAIVPIEGRPFFDTMILHP